MSCPETAIGVIAWEAFKVCRDIPAALAVGQAKGADPGALADYLLAIAGGASEGEAELLATDA